MSNFEPALFLEEYYCPSSSDIRTLTRLEAVLLDKVTRQCALYPADIYYDQGWVKMLLVLDKTYSAISPELLEEPLYKESTLRLAKWLLQLVQRRPQLSANNVCASLKELVDIRKSLIDFLETRNNLSNPNKT